MRNDIINRVIKLNKYIVSTRASIRDIAEKFGMSKSAVHMDLTERLKKINYMGYLQVKEILDFNLKESHIRGGESTKRKYNLKDKEK